MSKPELTLAFIRATLGPKQEGRFVLQALEETQVTGPLKLRAEGYRRGSESPVDLFVVEFRVGLQTLIAEHWASTINRPLGTVFNRVTPTSSAYLCVRNPYAVPVEVHATVRGVRLIPGVDLSSEKTDDELVRLAEEKLEETERRLRKINAGMIANSKAAALKHMAKYQHSERIRSEKVPATAAAELEPVRPMSEKERAEIHSFDLRAVAGRELFDDKKNRESFVEYCRDVDASLARQLEILKPVDEADDAAWESPTDEWP